MTKEWIIRNLLFGLFLLFSFIIYLPTLGSSYLPDDYYSIKVCEQKSASGLPALLRYFWLAPKESALVERPVTVITFWLNYKMGGVSPVIYKVTNIFLHALCAFGIFILFQYLCRLHAPWEEAIIPLGASLIFLCHPAHFLTVDNIVRRSIILSAILGILGFYSFLKYQHENKRLFYFLALICLVLSPLARASGAVFIAIILLYIGLFSPAQIRMRLYLLCLPMILFIGGILIYLQTHQYNAQHSNLNYLQFPILESWIIWKYWKIFFWPWPLPFSYEIWRDFSPFLLITWASILFHSLVIGTAVFIVRLKDYKLLGFSILCTYLLILPESGLYPMRFPMLVYRTYFPFMFLSFSCVLFLATRFRNHRVLTIFLVSVCLVFGGITFLKNTSIDQSKVWFPDKRFKSAEHINFINMLKLSLTAKMNQPARLNDQIILLQKDKSDSEIYRFLKDMAVNGPLRSLKENIDTIRSYPPMPLPKDTLPFFLIVIDKIITNTYPDNQKNILSHEIFFRYILDFTKENPALDPLKHRYSEILHDLDRPYTTSLLLTPQQEWDKERIHAAIAILNKPSGEALQQYLDELFRKNPSWQVFWQEK